MLGTTPGNFHQQKESESNLLLSCVDTAEDRVLSLCMETSNKLQ